jgi:hypothetical protein
MRLRRLLFPFVTSSGLAASAINDVHPQGSHEDRIIGHDYNMKEWQCKRAKEQKSKRAEESVNASGLRRA